MKRKTTPVARNLYLIVRGPKPEYHNAPYHQVILCSRKHTAKWESQLTSEGHTLFVNMDPDSSGNWLLVKYKGYDIDYGTVTHYFKLFDGKESREVSDKQTLDSLLKEAVWWSYDQMPVWVKELGIKYPEDDFTKKRIVDDFGMCLLPYMQQQKLKDKLDEYDEPEWLRV